jgi:hypothetical protein
MDGVAQTATNFNNTLLVYPQNGSEERRLDLRADLGDDLFIVSVSNWAFQNPPENGIVTKVYDTNVSANGGMGPNRVCNSTSSGNLCDAGLGSYMVDGITSMSENLSGEPTGTITITENNAADRTVSGTFDFKVSSMIPPNTTPVHFTGSFTDLSYIIQE